MPIRIERLPEQLRKGLAPVYLFAGPEPLLVQECRDFTLAAARQAGFLERSVLEVDKHFDWDELAAAGAETSLFATRRVIDLRLPTGKPGAEGSKALCAWVESPDPDRLLVVSCEQWDKGSRESKWSKALDRAGVRVDIWGVKPQEMPAWIKGRMEQAGMKPDREAVLVLAERLEGNLLAARQEVEKLRLLHGAGKISAEDVLRSVADSSRYDSFLLAERILSGQAAEGLRVAAGLQRTGVAIQLVTAALARELGILEEVLRATAAGENLQTVFRRLNVWPARQGPMRTAAGRVSPQRLDQGFQCLSRIDRQSKGMADGDAWQSLDQLVCALAGR